MSDDRTQCSCYPALRDEIQRLHGLVCAARTYIDPDKHPRWEAQAVAEATRCEDTSEKLRDEIVRLWEVLRDIRGSGVELDDPRIPYVTVQIDRTTWEELNSLKISKSCAALTDAPAPPRTD